MYTPPALRVPSAVQALVVGQETLESSSTDVGCGWTDQVLPFQ
jgi:hypothetical protein